MVVEIFIFLGYISFYLLESSSIHLGRIIYEEIGHFIGGLSLIFSQSKFRPSRAHILSLGPSFAKEITYFWSCC
jgi:hypothetical protein